MCGAERSTATVAITVNNVNTSRHSRSTTIAANFQSFTTCGDTWNQCYERHKEHGYTYKHHLHYKLLTLKYNYKTFHDSKMHMIWNHLILHRYVWKLTWFFFSFFNCTVAGGKWGWRGWGRGKEEGSRDSVDSEFSCETKRTKQNARNRNHPQLYKK